MAYVAPTTRADGYVVPASVWNSDVVANPIAINAGAIAIASQATGDVITASSATQLSRVAPGAAKTALISNGAGIAPSFQSVTVTGQANGDVVIANSTTSLTVVSPGAAGTVLTSNGAGVAPSFGPAGTMLLLRANSGSSTNAAAENVDTVAISGLTAKDTLIVYYTLQAVTQQTTTITLYNSTDSVVFSDLNSQAGLGALTAGQNIISESLSRQSQDAATAVYNFVSGYKTSNTSVGNAQAATFTTNWTGAWTLALRHGGVTAGGTFRWAWAVYKVAGQ